MVHTKRKKSGNEIFKKFNSSPLAINIYSQ